MKVINFGSLNIDHVYELDHFVKPGETCLSQKHTLNPGGKGFNQSVALAKAGAHVIHAGCIGADGKMFLELFDQLKIDHRHVKVVEAPTGHAIIQLVNGENSIIVEPGANNCIDEQQIEDVIKDAYPGDLLLLQNEINNLPLIIQKAKERQMKIVLNAAPMNEKIKALPLDEIGLLIVNETEATELVHASGTSEDDLVPLLKKMFPHKEIVLTLGEKGSLYLFEDTFIKVPADHVEAVDTTGAGDTFIGYLLSCIMEGKSIKEALTTATSASALTVQKKGASQSIPDLREVETYSLYKKAVDLPRFKMGQITYKKGRYNKELPVYDETLKTYVYNFYKHGLLVEGEAPTQDISSLDLIDTISALSYYMRHGGLSSETFANAIKAGTIQKLDDHLHRLLETYH
jgi:ribokinase